MGTVKESITTTRFPSTTDLNILTTFCGLLMLCHTLTPTCKSKLRLFQILKLTIRFWEKKFLLFHCLECPSRYLPLLKMLTVTFLTPNKSVCKHNYQQHWKRISNKSINNAANSFVKSKKARVKCKNFLSKLLKRKLHSFLKLLKLSSLQQKNLSPILGQDFWSTWKIMHTNAQSYSPAECIQVNHKLALC